VAHEKSCLNLRRPKDLTPENYAVPASANPRSRPFADWPQISPPALAEPLTCATERRSSCETHSDIAPLRLGLIPSRRNAL
jgi:hypothetical protein